MADGLVAFGSGKRLICMDGCDIDDALDRQIRLKVVLERKVRRAAETGRRGAGPRLSGHPHHAIDIVQPPGIGISPIADLDAHQTIVTAALAAKSSAEMPKKARWEARSETMRRDPSLPARSRITLGDS